MKYKLADIVDFNPTERLPKGTIAKKVAMANVQTFSRDIYGYEVEQYNGGAKFRNGDTIMARITPCLENGKSAYISFLDTNEIGYGSTEFIVWRAKDGVADSQYIYYLSQSPEIRDVAVKSMVGSSGRQRVQQGVLDNYVIDLPPLAQQIEIGHTLAALDAKIAVNTAINHNLEQTARAIFTERFGSYEPNGVLSDIANITMGQSPSGESFNEDGNGTVFYQGRAEFSSRFPTRRLFTTAPNRMAECGDVLLSVRAPVGDLNVASERCCIGRGLAAIRSKNDNQSFVLYSMFAAREQLDVFNGTGTVFGSINKAALENLPVYVPISDEAVEYESLVCPIDEQIAVTSADSVRLVTLRDTLLPRLMSGELSLPNG